MLEWDDDTEQMWRKFLNATAWIRATADHDPAPGAIESAWQSANRAAAELRQHLERIGTPVADVLANPGTRPRLLALAETIDVSPAELEWALQQLQSTIPARRVAEPTVRAAQVAPALLKLAHRNVGAATVRCAALSSSAAPPEARAASRGPLLYPVGAPAPAVRRPRCQRPAFVERR